ncbi:helix-turn-helix domain-containing protein [Pantoea ananatis]|jgi:transcriptional regulator with XRE-family HTH domain|uniref:helix-turn-helix domain-containing protein n=1 Tax=Pantoea ananas TaxID=553 RepID=UPI001B306AF6|nr:helix-turn-helix transcriptional regulator [Pantoea ananatis]
MKPISGIRKANLIYLLEARFEGNQTKMAQALNMLPNLISRWTRDKPMGSAAARKIERLLKLEDYWLDNDRDNVMPANPDVEIREVLANNLRVWMDKSESLRTQGKLHQASGVTQSTIGRVLNQEIDPTISTVNSIAKGFGRRGYELLIPAHDDRMIDYDRDAYSKLDASDKEKISSFVSFVISQAKSTGDN